MKRKGKRSPANKVQADAEDELEEKERGFKKFLQSIVFETPVPPEEQHQALDEDTDTEDE